MVTKKKLVILLITLITTLIAINYSKLDSMTGKFVDDSETGIVNNVVDGDTLDVNVQRIRLLGMNTPEKGEIYYKEAKDFLTGKVINKTIRLEKWKEDEDRYGRKLRYVFLNDENINLELVQNGFANFYFPSGKDRYYDEFKSAWEECVVNNLNLCEKSIDKCASCLELKELNVEKDSLLIANNCGFDCDLTNWSIKDEGRKKFIFPKFTLKNKVEVKVGDNKNQENVLFWKNQDYVWTKTGDTLFFRDNDGKLVFWYNF